MYSNKQEWCRCLWKSTLSLLRLLLPSALCAERTEAGSRGSWMSWLQNDVQGPLQNTRWEPPGSVTAHGALACRFNCSKHSVAKNVFYFIKNWRLCPCKNQFVFLYLSPIKTVIGTNTIKSFTQPRSKKAFDIVNISWWSQISNRICSSSDDILGSLFSEILFFSLKLKLGNIDSMWLE